MTISITADKQWGGFYYRKFISGERISSRLCLGYVAFDWFRDSLDVIFAAIVHSLDKKEAELAKYRELGAL